MVAEAPTTPCGTWRDANAAQRRDVARSPRVDKMRTQTIAAGTIAAKTWGNDTKERSSTAAYTTHTRTNLRTNE